jgi:4-oxalocrotonate tautomerase
MRASRHASTGIDMPLVQIYMYEGRTKELKTKLIEEVTRAVVDALGVKPEAVEVILIDVPRQHWARAGKPAA